MGNEAGIGEMVRIEIAELERELRAALAGRAARLGTTTGSISSPAAAGDCSRERGLRLVDSAHEAGFDR